MGMRVYMLRIPWNIGLFCCDLYIPQAPRGIRYNCQCRGKSMVFRGTVLYPHYLYKLCQPMLIAVLRAQARLPGGWWADNGISSSSDDGSRAL